jgi:hypothetical protein
LYIEGRLHGLLGRRILLRCFFLWGHLTEHVYAVSPTIIEDHMARPEAPVTAVDANMLRRVTENSVQRTTVCLGMDEGRFGHIL